MSTLFRPEVTREPKAEPIGLPAIPALWFVALSVTLMVGLLTILIPIEQTEIFDGVVTLLPEPKPISAPISGIITPLVAEGAQVVQGQPLVQIIPYSSQEKLRELAATVAQLKISLENQNQSFEHKKDCISSELEQARVALPVMNEALEVAEREVMRKEKNYTRAKQLGAQGVLSAKSLDDAEGDAETARSAYLKAKMQLLGQNAQINNLEKSLAQVNYDYKFQKSEKELQLQHAIESLAQAKGATLTAPIDGKVLYINEQAVAPGQVAVIIAHNQSAKHITIKTTDINEIKTGNRATVTFKRQHFFETVTSIRSTDDSSWQIFVSVEELLDLNTPVEVAVVTGKKSLAQLWAQT